MNERPEQPPEGKLIADATENSGLSIREASRRAGISYGRWRQIATGVQHVSPGEFAAVRAPARTLAKMAAVVGITPEQMATEGQRPDAAEVMRERSIQAARSGPPFPDATPEMEAAMDAYIDAVRDLVELARRKHPSGPLSGREVFPLDPRGAVYWDGVSGVGFRQEEGVIRGTAALLALAAQEAAAEREDDTAAGLRRRHIAGRHQRHRMVTTRT